jgi:signal transduction histidine kinase
LQRWLDMMAAFADQAALAWQLASAQRRMRELDVLTDRDRIARDLHYHVIQRLFAVGLALQGLRRNDATAATAGRGDRPVFESRSTYQRAVRGPAFCRDAALADHAEAVVREAVSNAVQHADANTLTVTVNVGDELLIEVADKGVGISGDITGSGLTNLWKRAEDVGGSFTIGNIPGRGTVLRWSAPLP